ncbi:hypothetical protein Droror1_Dr00024705 [Drosera rotundifolia]
MGLCVQHCVGVSGNGNVVNNSGGSMLDHGANVPPSPGIQGLADQLSPIQLLDFECVFADRECRGNGSIERSNSMKREKQSLNDKGDEQQPQQSERKRHALATYRGKLIKLQHLGGDHVDVLESLTPKVRKRVEVLRELQSKKSFSCVATRSRFRGGVLLTKCPTSKEQLKSAKEDMKELLRTQFCHPILVRTLWLSFCCSESEWRNEVAEGATS